MLAEVRLIVAAKEVRLVMKRGEGHVEDELWKLERRFTGKEAEEMCRVVFDDCYDLLNFTVHGDS